uniref:Uncharacterized protein n=1 Tax=Timema bartmani TaxID=61472 RepID=A0A7R9I1K1_9NEOP|nr:unnamed protein product [Timema bartmani]
MIPGVSFQRFIPKLPVCGVTPSQKVDLGRKRVAKKSGASKEAAKELLLAKAEKALDRDEFDSYFESVAAKMRRMNEEQRLFAEKIINESVFLGMFNRLTEFSHTFLQPHGTNHISKRRRLAGLGVTRVWTIPSPPGMTRLE